MVAMSLSGIALYTRDEAATTTLNLEPINLNPESFDMQAACAVQ